MAGIFNATSVEEGEIKYGMEFPFFNNGYC